MFVCCERCVSSGKGLCDELITYRLWNVVVCDLDNSENEEAMARAGPRQKKKSVGGKIYIWLSHFEF
jgi:hypothetical protein